MITTVGTTAAATTAATSTATATASRQLSLSTELYDLFLTAAFYSTHSDNRLIYWRLEKSHEVWMMIMIADDDYDC